MRIRLVILAPLMAASLACAGASSSSSPTPGTAMASRNAGCELRAQDSTFLAAGIVYRACAVDERTKLAMAQPRIDPPRGGASSAPQSGCYAATYEFVVDTLGRPVESTIRSTRISGADFAASVRAVIPTLRFTPARREGVKVQQITEFGQMVSVTVTRSGSSTPSNNAARATRC